MWILVVEDETSMREALRQGLEEENHTVALASDGLEGVHAAETCDFDAILLDVMMPGMDGIDLVRRLRAGGRQTPVLMLTARDAAGDVVRGLDAGADDYLTKPFSFRVLLARLRAISRRSAQPPKARLQVDDLLLDPASHEVWRGGVAAVGASRGAAAEAAAGGGADPLPPQLAIAARRCAAVRGRPAPSATWLSGCRIPTWQ